MFPSAADLAEENLSLRHRVEELRSEVAALKRELNEEREHTERLEALCESHAPTTTSGTGTPPPGCGTSSRKD